MVNHQIVDQNASLFRITSDSCLLIRRQKTKAHADFTIVHEEFDGGAVKENPHANDVVA